MDTPQSSSNNNHKRHKNWKRFRNERNFSQNSSQAQPNLSPTRSSKSSNPSIPSRSHSTQNKQPKDHATRSFSEHTKRSPVKEVLPPQYKIPEDLDLPTYVFSGENQSSLEENSGTLETTDNQALCPICNYPIKKFYTTVRHPGKDMLVHFDCALRELFQQYKNRLAKDERIYYIGAGRFAIVKEIRDKRGNVKNYQIIEKIEYEKQN